MNTQKFLYGSLLAGGALVAARLLFAKSSSVEPTSTGTSYDTIDAYIEDQMRRLSIPGVALVIVEGDKIVHLRGFGKAHPNGEPPTPQTPFFIGSVTKSFTALAIMQLVEAGKLELDAPVQRHLPWFRVADPETSSRMTVRHLLNQTSGLPMLRGMADLGNLDDRPGSTERQMRALSAVRLSNPVGTKFEYNNTNYSLLGLIIEAACGETYADYIQQNIFKQLEMHHSFTSREAAKQDGLAMGYRYWFGQPFPATRLSIPMGSLPSGQLISCAEDMAHFLIAQLNGGSYGNIQVLSSGGMDEMHRGAVEIVEMGMHIGSYGMGWISKVTGRSTIVSHGGIVPDFGAFVGLVPEQKKGIVLLYNANHAMIKMTFDGFGTGAAERLAGETPSKTVFGMAPWLMRGMALIPLLQVTGVALTLRRLDRWKVNSTSRPSSIRMWGQHILLPLLSNLLVASTLIPMLSKMRSWIQLFMPDFSWIAWICGGFAAIWAVLRTGLILKAVREPSRKNQ